MLVVDDSVDICDMLCTMARDMPDIDCTSLTTTRDIGPILKFWTPDILVMDLTIPGESPLDVIRSLHHTYPDIRTIAFTGHEDDATFDEVYDAGGWGLVGKNGDIKLLFDTIRRIAAAGPDNA